MPKRTALSFALLIAVLAPARGRAEKQCWGGNPYSYDAPHFGAKQLFESRKDLREDPVFALLLTQAAAVSDTPLRQESRRKLVEFAFPIGLALGAVPSGGSAPAFFHLQLTKTPVDYHEIIDLFAAYEPMRRQSFHELLLLQRAPASSQMMRDHAQAMAQVFWREALLDGTPPSPQPPPPGPGGINWSLQYAVDYRQDNYQPQDLQGDVSLVVIAKKVPKVMVEVAAGLRPMPIDGSRHPYEDLNPIVKVDDGLPSEQDIERMGLPPDEKERKLVWLRNKRLVIEGRRDPIRVPAMTKMFTQLFAEETQKGLPPKFGQPLGWSAEFAAKYRGRLDMYDSRVSKLLIALSVGLTSKYMATGRERALIEYLLTRPERSVTFHEMFRASYELNGGDVYLALLTCENILSEFWRTPQREDRAVTRRLAPITNVYDGRGDIFGTWYHFFGTLLYSYVTNAKIAGSVARTESLGSVVLAEGREKPQKAWVNREGAVLGDEIKHVLMRQDYLDFDPGGMDYTDPKVYLNLTEDFRDRIFIAESKDFSGSVSRGDVVLKSARDYANCKVEMMPDVGSGFDSEKTVVLEKRSFPKGSEVRFPGFSRRVTAVRTFLSGCDGGLEATVTAKSEASDAR